MKKDLASQIVFNFKWAETQLVTARKRSLRQGNIFTPVCHSVHSGGHAWLLPGGAWLLPGGRAWLLWGGACVVAPGGHAWLLPGGACVGYDEIWRYDQ